MLIGIDDYQASSVTDLGGAVNDVELMRATLTSKFDVPASNIKLLTNQEATRQGIFDAIRTHLIEPAKAGDVVILHYSGHGSQMKDGADQDEIDGYDETSVPHDSRTEGVFDISDDEINGLLKQLTQRTKNVTFILDSCHSGAAARAGNQVRQIKPDDRPPPPPAAFAISARGSEGDAGFRLNGSDYVLISGCLATELSNEKTFSERKHGVMTWFLNRALQSARSDSTYKAVMDRVKEDVTNEFPTQHPQIEGPGMDVKVFGTDKINPRPYVIVEPVDGRLVKLRGGTIFGLQKDASLKVYPFETADFANATPIATVKVINVEDFTAQAEVQGDGTINEPAKALIDVINFGEAVSVYVDASASESMAEVKRQLEENRGALDKRG